jgi:hypothetical protein
LHEFKQFSTQDFHIQLEPCGAQKDLEVLQQTRYVLWQPKKQREKEDKKKNVQTSNPSLSSWQKICILKYFYLVTIAHLCL